MNNHNFKIKEVIKKNSANAPGLTIVNWCNKPELTKLVTKLKNHYNNNYENILWYKNQHLHITISALTRTKYQQIEPIKKIQLPENIHYIVNLIASQNPFEITITHYLLRESGQIQLEGKVQESDKKTLINFRNLAKQIDPNFQYLNKPKIVNEQIHINLGYFSKIPSKIFSIKKNKLEIPISMKISDVSIVHYFKRTLEIKFLFGTIDISLENKEEITSETFYKNLKIN